MEIIEENKATNFGFFIVRPENGGILDLFKFFVFDNKNCGEKFVEISSQQELLWDGGGEVTRDHRWVIIVSIIVRKLIKVLGKPMELTGYVVEFILNLLSLNGDFIGLLYRILQGNVVLPQRNSETFLSTIGHLDGRLNLCKMPQFVAQENSIMKHWKVGKGNRTLMDLCVMAAKLAYENAKVVQNVVENHWKMCFIDFYNCWNDYQKQRSTQVFIICDKLEDANLIIISFRGTEPFDADDWITDFDYSWYEIPQLGKVHMGFLEALGLGNRGNTFSFRENLQVGKCKLANSNGSEKETIPLMEERTAYYSVRNKLKELLKKHPNAKFTVTGHSLGGALAILFPVVLVLHEEQEVMQHLLGVYTYGQPRVGNMQLCTFMEAHLEHPSPKYFRVVYCNDLVPRLPYDDKTFLYKHFGVCQYYNSLYIEQNVDEEPNRNYFSLRYLIPEYLNAAWELARSLLMGFIYGPDYKESWESFVLRMLGLLVPGLAAHNPIEYVNSVRLGRMRSPSLISS